MRILLSILMVTVISANSFSQSIPYSVGFINLQTPTVFDARAHSLGKCEIMASNGANAIFANPAHIANIKRGRIQFSETAKFGSYENGYWDNNSEWIVTEEYESQFEVSQFSFVLPQSMANNNSFVTLGIGLNKEFDFSEEYSDIHKNVDSGTEYKINTKFEGGIYFLAPSIAFQFSNNIQIGFTYHRSVFGEERYSSIYNGPGDDYHNTILYNQDMSTSYFSFGTVYQLNRKLSLGMIYKSEMEIDVEEYMGYSEYPYDDSRPERPAYTIDIPSVFGIGGEFKLNQTITLYGEYQTRKFSEIEMSHNYSHYGWDSIDINDGACIRTGLDISKDGKSLRIGFFQDSLPITNLDYSSAKDDKTPLLQNGFTYGAGYQTGKFLIEFGGEYSVINSEARYTTITDPFGINNRYDITKTNHNLYASFSYLIN